MSKEARSAAVPMICILTDITASVKSLGDIESTTTPSIITFAYKTKPSISNPRNIAPVYVYYDDRVDIIVTLDDIDNGKPLTRHYKIGTGNTETVPGTVYSDGNRLGPQTVHFEFQMLSSYRGEQDIQLWVKEGAYDGNLSISNIITTKINITRKPVLEEDGFPQESFYSYGEKFDLNMKIKDEEIIHLNYKIDGQPRPDLKQTFDMIGQEQKLKKTFEISKDFAYRDPVSYTHLTLPTN